MNKTKIVSTVTPWGQAQTVTKIAPGINFYTTASHGGFKLSEGRNKKVSQKLKESTWQGLGLKGWYEEDEDQLIVVITFPEFFTSEQISFATICLLNRR